MDKSLIDEVKKKKVFSKIPDELVWKFLRKNKLNIKETRSDIRKFLGVFLTNKVLKKNDESILRNHISSKNRDYSKFYEAISEVSGAVKNIVDLGAGINGFSYNFLTKYFGDVNYIGFEAAGQLVDKTNVYFFENKLAKARVLHKDISEGDFVKKHLSHISGRKIILMLQIVDALENIKRDFSKDFLLSLRRILSKEDFIVITMPLKSISGRKRFEAQRTWLVKFLEKNFEIKKNTDIDNEKLIIIGKGI
ncbi:hypothetical protein CMI41_02860 [Candidatus Pacearchaeota archaeon]|nr:hypothetical protein [Candidatus Pacearchaeota archaeon]|tara:strand:+ start:9332 stop:10081 length:750 start_codon:yes stop_codon:yes gene_type:complete